MPIRLSILFFILSLTWPLNSQTPSNTIDNQFKFAPSDSRFLYEKRFIPENQNIDRLKAPEIKNSQASQSPLTKSSNFSIKLPNFTQTLVIIGLLVIFILYRIQVNKKNKQSSRRRR